MLEGPSRFGFEPARLWGLGLCLICVLPLVVYLLRRGSDDEVHFSRDVRPILNQNCMPCHGGVRQKNGISFLFREEALGTGKSGKRTIVPGKPDESELIAREAFAPIAEHIIVADPSRTVVTDHSADALAAMKRLRVLRLMYTHLSDATLLRLDSLQQLESLNVYGSAITPAVLPTIAKLPKLAHFYAGQTGIVPGKSVPENLGSKLVF